MFLKMFENVWKGVLKNFAIVTGKHLCWTRFLIKFFCLSEADQNLLKKESAEFLQFLGLKTRLQHRCFPVNFAKLLRTFIL